MVNKLEDWKKWINEIYKDFREVYFNRHVFWEVQDIIKNNPDLENFNPNKFNLFLAQSYFDYSVSAIRRQIKHNKSSVSLVGLLEDIIQNPSVLSRKQFVCLYPGEKDKAKCLFDKRFAGKSLGHVDPIIVCQDLSDLKTRTKKVEDFADTQVSHIDKKVVKKGRKGSPTFNVLDDCIDYLAELIQKYYLLVIAKDLGSNLSVNFIEDWKEIFYQPWILPEASSG